jgi:prepilin-type N-terminal cleavage/methylation domain-containing protein
MKKHYLSNQSGFTLIEMIVSLGVFSVVATTSVGAMLVLISTNQQLQSEQSVMTNLAFALDTMTREIRTGYNYYCEQQPNYASSGGTNIFNNSNNHENIVGTSVQDCPSGRSHSTHNLQGVSFYEGGSSITGSEGARRIMYYFDGTDPENKTIMRRVGNQPAQSIVSSGLSIVNAEFVVTGSSDLENTGNAEQPTVTVYIEAQDRNDSTGKTYYLQTTVTQRTLDL